MTLRRNMRQTRHPPEDLLDLADQGIKQLVEKQKGIVGHLIKRLL